MRSQVDEQRYRKTAQETRHRATQAVNNHQDREQHFHSVKAAYEDLVGEQAEKEEQRTNANKLMPVTESARACSYILSKQVEKICSFWLLTLWLLTFWLLTVYLRVFLKFVFVVLCIF